METKEINNELEIATKENIEAKTIESTAELPTETEKAKELPSTFKPFDEAKQINTNKSDVWIIFGILCTIFVLLSIIIFCTFSLINIQSTTIAKGVYIKGIDVSRLTKEEARKKITDHISSSIPEEINLKHNNFETSLSTAQLSIYFNTDEAVNLAYNIGKKRKYISKKFINIKSIIF